MRERKGGVKRRGNRNERARNEVTKREGERERREPRKVGKEIHREIK